MNEQNQQSSSASSGASSRYRPTGDTDRDQFTPDELAIVLSHYDLGTIQTIHEFPRGSRRSPKLLVRTEKGVFLLKRRAKGKDDPFKVAFAHSLQLYLTEKHFPLPHLIGTKLENNSMLQWTGSTYEIFEYIKGTGYDNSLEATQDAGKTLALFHKLIRDHQPEYEPPRGSYHASKTIRTSMDYIPRKLEKVDPRAFEFKDRITQVVDFLRESYNTAAQKTNEIGLSSWPMQITHSDWHPGNMLFRGQSVVAVIDYDSARLQQRIIDVANGALQFSIIGGGEDAAQWPNYLDISRYKRFLRGYDMVNVLSKAELHTLPWLMTEALIAESSIPIAMTGSFAQMDGFGFLEMVERKVNWLLQHANELANLMDV